MPELTPQHEARNIAALAAWCMFEAEIHETLTAAGCTPEETEAFMTTEVYQ